MNALASARLGAHLKRLREERKLTLGAVERLTADHEERINKTYLFRVERGKTLPTLSRLHVLARVYRVRLPKLLEVLEGAIEESEQVATGPAERLVGTFEEMRGRGVEAHREGDFVSAALFFRASLDTALEEPGSAARSSRIALARHDLSIALKNVGKLGLAQDEAERAAEEPDIEAPLLDRIKLNLADVYWRTGRNEMCRMILNDLLSRNQDVGREVLSGAHSLMGSLLLRKNPRDAARHYRSALQIQRPLKDSLAETMLLVNIGIAETNAGNFQRSIRALRKSLELARRKDYNYLVAKARSEMGRSLFQSGNHAEARSTLLDANRFARDREYFEVMFINGYYLRQIALQDGKLPEARTIEGSLRFFLTRFEASSEEMESFKKELQSVEEPRR